MEGKKVINMSYYLHGSFILLDYQLLVTDFQKQICINKANWYDQQYINGVNNREFNVLFNCSKISNFMEDLKSMS